MSVLHLRRGMAVEDEQDVATPEGRAPADESPTVEIPAALPLRRRLAISDEPAEEASAADEPEEELYAERGGGLRKWLTGAAVLGALSIYPAMMVAASDVDGSQVASSIDRSQWMAPWAGGAVALLEHHYAELGWASDAADFTPMSMLSGKPALQAAMAQSVGEYLGLFATPAAGDLDPDLRAAVRLVDAGSTGVQLRAAADALRSFDRRLKRQGGDRAMSPEQIAGSFGLMDAWAERSKTELAKTRDFADGVPLDKAATVAVFAARGRAQAAHAFLSTMDWPDDPAMLAARNAAVAAWGEAAAFEPLVVLNAAPDAALLGNHPTSMGFLVERAQAATRAYAQMLRPQIAG